jgi:hypothetical protein
MMRGEGGGGDTILSSARHRQRQAQERAWWEVGVEKEKVKVNEGEDG